MNTSFLRSLVALTMILMTTTLASADDTKQLQSAGLKPRFIAVDDLGAEYHTSSNTITVKATITNVSRRIQKGFATIYLLSKEGQEVYSFQEEVNNGEPFDHGSSVDFKASAQVGDISKVSSISVDFTQK
jgi:hypothetical protein